MMEPDAIRGTPMTEPLLPPRPRPPLLPGPPQIIENTQEAFLMALTSPPPPGGFRSGSDRSSARRRRRPPWWAFGRTLFHFTAGMAASMERIRSFVLADDTAFEAGWAETRPMNTRDRLRRLGDYVRRDLLMASREALDQTILHVIHLTMPRFPMRLQDFREWRMAGLIRRLRRRAILACSFVAVTVPISLFLLYKGAMLVLKGDLQMCNGLLRWWLYGFLIIQVFFPSLTLLIFLWSFGGAAIKWWATTDQDQQCTEISQFVTLVFKAQLLQLGCFAAALVIALCSRRLVEELAHVYQAGQLDGSVMEAMLERTIVVSPARMPPDSECVICLRPVSESEGVWRVLECKHSFHEACIMEWFLRSGKCPCCRWDLREEVISRLERW